MKQPNFNLDREFIKWYYEEIYPEMGSNRSMVHSYGIPHNTDTRDYWMRESFKQGAQAMWDEINLALLEYATAVEGCDPYMVEPCEIYDGARESLHYYIHQQLRLFP